jgi:hypothetical protein
VGIAALWLGEIPRQPAWLATLLLEGRELPSGLRGHPCPAGAAGSST